MDSYYICGGCDHVMKANTPSVSCISCCQWIHLKTCANLTYKEAKKLKNLYQCSKCTVSCVDPGDIEKKRKQKHAIYSIGQYIKIMEVAGKKNPLKLFKWKEIISLLI